MLQYLLFLYAFSKILQPTSHEPHLVRIAAVKLATWIFIHRIVSMAEANWELAMRLDRATTEIGVEFIR